MASVNTYYALASSVRGTSHERDGSERQDRLLVADVAGALVICLADGVGSSVHGGDAAALAVNEALTVLGLTWSPSRGAGARADGTVEDDAEVVTAPVPDPPVRVDWPTAVRCAIAAARSAVSRLPAHHPSGGQKDAFYTTLAVAVVVDDEVFFGQIGDGYCICWSPEEEASPTVLGETKGEGEPNVVVPLTAPGAMERLTVTGAQFPANGYLLVSTDGLAPALLDRWYPPRPSGRFLMALGSSAQEGQLSNRSLAAFLRSEMICARTDDDKSVVLVGTRSFTDAEQVTEWPDNVPDAHPEPGAEAAAEVSRPVTTPWEAPTPESAAPRAYPRQPAYAEPLTYAEPAYAEQPPCAEPRADAEPSADAESSYPEQPASAELPPGPAPAEQSGMRGDTWLLQQQRQRAALGEVPPMPYGPPRPEPDQDERRPAPKWWAKWLQ